MYLIPALEVIKCQIFKAGVSGWVFGQFSVVRWKFTENWSLNYFLKVPGSGGGSEDEEAITAQLRYTKKHKFLT